MTQVFQPYSRFTVPLDTLLELVEEDKIDLPAEIGELSTKQVNNTLHIESTATDDSFGRYTPTAMLKASISEKLIVVEDDGTHTHDSVSAYEKDQGWGGMDEEEEDLETTTVTYANFHGQGDEVLVHDALRGEMFEVLCELTTEAIKGHLTGIVLEDDELQPVRYEAGGEACDVELTVSKSDDPAEENAPGNVPVSWS